MIRNASSHNCACGMVFHCNVAISFTDIGSDIIVEKKKKKGSEGSSDSDAPAYVPRRNEKGFQWVKMIIGSKQSVSA